MFGHLIKVFTNQTGHPMFDDFGERAAAVSEHGRTTSQRFDQNQSERFGPIIRTNHSKSIADEIILLHIVHFTDKFNQRMIQ